MKRDYKILASMVCGDPCTFADDLAALKAGGADGIHFDVMDGRFVPRYGMYPEQLQAIKKISDLPVDVHLMVEEPEKYIRTFAEVGGDYIVVHAEATRHLQYALQSIRALGKRAGVALNPATPLCVLDYVLPDLDLIMLMAINPGIVGHKLIPGMMQKIKDTREKVSAYPDIVIEIDGGVSPESASAMVNNGADMLVCGTSSIFKKDKRLEDSIPAFRCVVDEGLKG